LLRREEGIVATCPSCASDVPEGNRFCGSCGAAIETPTSAPTETSLKSAPRAGSHPTPDQARFIPGTMLAKRYRVVGLLGRGGMGEVYRADDLKLGQPVALKFLPEAVQRDQARLDRFLNEVKTALKVTHPNVCRVYDIGEVPSTGSGQGQHYISMEYVDGEDLASLLRRIGRLPQDKAIQIARQLCAGLAAAHEEGILHRDLKPANVMIDGRGRAKITDFGLAGLAEGIEGDEVRAGTPQYMAPEQLSGKEVTVKSDIYALGLLLYELFTGKRAFEAGSPQEMAQLQESAPPTSPSSHISGLDPAVERVILRCLEPDPRQRPAGALAVAAALPGEDPLAAALAAGETPSPEMVADAGGAGGLRPAVGMLLLALVAVGLIAEVALYHVEYAAGRIPLERPPEALSVTAQEIIARAGYDEKPVDSAYGFEFDGAYVQSVRSQDPSPTQWDDLATIRPAPIFFWYRQSPRYLAADGYLSLGSPVIKPNSPPWSVSGMVGVRLDPQGRLLRFKAVPPQNDASGSASQVVDWSWLFDSAGLDQAALTSAEPERNPLLDCDRRFAWEGSYPDQPELPIRVEAGSYRGKAAYFELVAPWMRSQNPEGAQPFAWLGESFFTVLLLLLIVGGFLLARRNIRLGRGDRRGAFRLAAFLFLSQTLVWILVAHHVPTLSELRLLFSFMGYNLIVSGLAWLVYIAMEPYARRIWPKGMIAWNRLMDGRIRDPLLGRDILIGAAGGVTMQLWWGLYVRLIDWLSLPSSEPMFGDLTPLIGVRQAIAVTVDTITESLYSPIGWLFIVLLLRTVLRRQWLAALVVMLGSSLSFALQDVNPMLHGFFTMVAFGIFFFILLRLGLLSAIASMVFFYVGVASVLTVDMSSWYAGRSLFTMLLLATIALYAFYISLGGRPLFQRDLLGD
jgi:hypothetical protein